MLTVALCPCILRLNPFASLIIWSVASVVCNALTKRVDNDFKPLKAFRRSLTLLLYAVFLVTKSANFVSASAFNAISCGNFNEFLMGCKLLRNLLRKRLSFENLLHF